MAYDTEFEQEYDSGYESDYQDYGQPVVQKSSPPPPSRGWSIFDKLLDKSLDIGGTILGDRLAYGKGRSTAGELSRERQGYAGINGSGPNQQDPRFMKQSQGSTQPNYMMLGLGGLVAILVVVLVVKKS
jgi:hypothetical protein